MIAQFVLTHEEIQRIKHLLDDLSGQFSTPEAPDFLNDAAVFAHELPFRLRKFLNDFRLKETRHSTVCVISGYPVDNERIGPTPIDRGIKDDTQRTLNEQMLLVLLASLLGEPVGWSTQQAGHIVHDISPVKGQEHDQTGSSSQGELLFHTEDAFHPYRGDYLGMMCLRNRNRAATSLASNQVITRLSQAEIQTLFEPRFVIRPDASQFEKHKFNALDGLTEEEFERFSSYSATKIKQMNTKPEPVAVLFGDPASPYMRVDCPVYMDALDDAAATALHALRSACDDTQIDMVLEAGDICFIDNYRAVHGRKPFKARYDGTDRWLKRVNVLRDIRKSRDMRMTSTSRIIF